MEIPDLIIKSPKNYAIAKSLMEYGFCYSGSINDFCEGSFLGNVGGWRIYSAIGEIGIDAVCDDYLFALDIHCSTRKNFEEELKKIKRIIINEAKKWSKRKNYKQLKLPI
ncbi:MAG: hypothetical protein RLZZ86_333 [Cyanobacteriota bacterium]|jgi:hypothetical protein